MTRIAVLLAATALGVGALGCGGSDDQSTTGVSLPAVTVPTAPQSQAPTTTAAGASNQGKEGRETTTGSGARQASCPPSLSESDCRALGEAVSKGGATGGSVRCTPEMTPETCQLLKQIAGSNASPGSAQRVPGCEGLSREECLALFEKNFGGG
jgi:hypothetical protein